MKTFMARNDEVARQWVLVDATDMVLGRLAADVAAILRGKTKPEYTPHTDVGDFVVVINADKIKVTGKKEEQKLYRRHSGYMGGLKELTLKQMMEKKPEEVIRLAVKGMLPKGSLGSAQLKKLKVYAGAEHPHAAQLPQQITL
ncbi:MAG: 50S ribosomal protein L13 [Deltaproteobacteria bacterium ADurb.Bin510]|jgi:large subunit ribosomal protein L13|nr:MAG: 50S ribosomal protein L13 [Deltaproteobacteria bacterium ADurb.Bin510]